MTVLVDTPERNWPVGVNDAPFSVPANDTRIVCKLTHPDWPEGECMRVFVTWPNGDTGQGRCGGGVVRDKAGNPTGGTTDLIWTCAKPPGVITGNAHIEFVQALRSAIFVESVP